MNRAKRVMQLICMMFSIGWIGIASWAMAADGGEAVSQKETSVTENLRPANSSIYFAYDSTAIGDDEHALLEEYVRFYCSQKSLGKHPQFVLEGNTDQRGSREYNIAKGTFMADSVRAYLIEHGVNQSDISTVSFGEEHSVCQGDKEPCMAQNRRVDIVMHELQ